MSEINKNTDDKTLMFVVVRDESKLAAMVIAKIDELNKKLDSPIRTLFSPSCKL